MKKIFKKNQVIITALAIMIAVAGYLNFTSDNEMLDTTKENVDDAMEVSASDDEVISAAVEDTIEETDYANDSDATDSSSVDEPEMAETNEEPSSEAVTDTDENTSGEYAQASLDENGDPIQAEDVGEAVLTNGAVTISEAKMNREQVRAKAKDMLLEIINNEKLTEDSKKEAISKMMSMTENMEKENAAETQLAAKGFPDSIVTISEDNVDVTVNCAELSGKQRAQIEDIITRKTGCEINKIIITTAQIQNEI